MRTTALVLVTGLLFASPAAAQTAPAPPCAPLREQASLPKAHSSEATMIAGQTMVGLAAASTVGGIVLALVPSHCNGFLCGLDRVVGGGGMVVGGMLLGGIGAAFWAAGGKSPAPGKQDASWLRPNVSIGAGSAAVTWSF